MRSIAVCNLKGGVGKTTSSVNIGASLARRGKRVLLIDCDPQCNLTTWLRATPDDGEATLYEILRGQATVRSAAIDTNWPNLWIVPGSPRIHEIDRGALAGERVLWARLNADYDYTLFDCSASPGVVLANAISAANEIIAPVQAKGMALGGIERLRALIHDIAQRGNPDAHLSGVIVCLFDGRTRISRAVLGELRAQYGTLVFDTVVHEDVKLAEAADRRLPITEYAPQSRAAAEYAAIAFELLTRSARGEAHTTTGASRLGGGRSFSTPPASLPMSATSPPQRHQAGRSPATAHHLPRSDSHLGQD